MDNELISLRELAERCQVHPNTIRRYVRTGDFAPSAILRNHYYFTGEDALAIERFLRIPRPGRAYHRCTDGGAA